MLSSLYSFVLFHVDTTSFYGIIVKYIHILLREREGFYNSSSNWVLEEAMNTRKLHIGGTFKNALAKRIDNVIIPFFAEVIAFIDRNQNLYHLKDLGKRQCTMHDLWLHIFSTPELFSLNFAEIAGRDKAPVDDGFRCKFPFSWLIKEAVDNQWENVTSGKVYQSHIMLITNLYYIRCLQSESIL